MPLTRFGRMAFSRCFVAAWAALIAGALNHAQAQRFVPPPPPPVPPPPPPVFNPSTPYTVPSVRETPVSPGSGIGPSRLRLGVELPPAKSSCNLFHSGPCFPQYLPPIGQDLRLTIISTDDDHDQETGSGADANKGGNNPDKTAVEKPLDSIPEMYAALRACWTPPPKDEARHGMEYTIRFAFRRDGEIIAPPRRTYSSHEAPDEVRDTYRDTIDAALQRCTPLHFSTGMAGAVGVVRSPSDLSTSAHWPTRSKRRNRCNERSGRSLINVLRHVRFGPKRRLARSQQSYTSSAGTH
jgi:hypothetical protein